MDALPGGALASLLSRFRLKLELVADNADIPGSYWGEEEAGLIGDRVYVRSSTPVHSALHEACHYVCMDAARRDSLNRDAGGDYDEENGVCYLQILLADFLPGLDRSHMFADMDAWGYTFRLGSAHEWFERDAEDARAWLTRHGLIDAGGTVTFELRGAIGATFPQPIL